MQSPGRIALLCLSLPAGASALTAQSHPIVGRWDISFERGRRFEQGASTPVMAAGTLAIEARGRVLLATLQPSRDASGATPSPQRWTGTITADGARFVVSSKATMNCNGETSEVVTTSSWTLSARDRALSGTMRRVIEGEALPITTSAVTGTRRGS